MTIDKKKYGQPAIRRDVGRVAIKASVAFGRVAIELERIRNGEKPTEEGIAKIEEMAKELEKHFDTLSGWSDE